MPRQMSKSRWLILAASAAALVALWLIRPIWHGLALSFWTAPIVWLPPLLILAAGVVALRRSRRSWTTIEELARNRDVPVWMAVFPVGALVTLIVMSGLHGALVNRAIVTNNTYEEIAQLPADGKPRLVPRDVAEISAQSGLNSSTEQLTNFRIVNTPEGLTWTALRTPQGTFRIFSAKSQGLVTLDAEDTNRTLEQVDGEFETAPGLQITDNLRWRLLKERFLIKLEEPVAIPTPDGPRILVPYLEHKGFPIRRPVIGGVFVVSPNGDIEDLEPEEAAQRPELAITGRIFSDAQARRIQDAYAYKGGLWNTWFVHEEQTQITDTETNRQPYMIDFGGELGTQWVTVAEPFGRPSAASAIFLTDTRSGATKIWRVPEGGSLSGNRRALETVQSIPIPGIARQDFRVVEPRPVFVEGRLVYLTSLIPLRSNAVSKTVVVDAQTNKLVAIFDNDRDPQAEEKTLAYLETGVVPEGAGQQVTDPAVAATPTDPDPAPTPTPAATPGATPGDVNERIDQLIEGQRDTLRELEQLQRQLREGE